MNIDYKNKIFENLTLEEFITYQHEQLEEFKNLYIKKNLEDSYENPLTMKYCGWIGEFIMSGF